MTEQDAIELVQRAVLSSKPDCSLIRESHEEHFSCFVFFYQSKKYIESGNTSDMYVGHGPVIVSKSTGSVFETSSQKSSVEYVAVFEACGDPNAEKTATIEISGWNEGANKVECTKIVKRYSGLGLADSKGITDKALGEVPSSFLVAVESEVNDALTELAKAGFKSRQLWSNEC